ncbi:carbohydrate-binding protein [Chitinophaga nivalis]|uniref:carbohydrate-binding protein n=1 Tax=Chitinophaga nivalis TaxID=2991709 RepID=UPI0027D973C0|nr:carbohydrate-binding protein [Chitinophaga nivalis]
MRLRFNPKIVIPIITGLMFVGLSSNGNNDKGQPKIPVLVKTNSPLQRISCFGVKPWLASAVYTGGELVVYQGRLYQARWWTQGETPGVNIVWTDKGACD